MKLEEVVILSRLQLLRIFVLLVTRVEALLLRLEFHTLTIVLYLLYAKEQIHGSFKLFDLIDSHFSIRIALTLLFASPA